MAYVSLKDVAARAGVSFQTASKALLGRTDVVSDATRERIEAAARDLGYVPNALARGLVSRASYAIGVLADDLEDPSLVRFVVAAQREAEHRGHVALVVSGEPGQDPRIPVRKLLERRVDGILVVAPDLEDDPRLGEALRAARPAVSLNHVPGGGVPVVCSDDVRTGRMVARHLLGLGHREIGTVTGPVGRRVVGQRADGFARALAAGGVELPPDRVVATGWNAEAGRTAAHALLDAHPGLTAVFAHNDVIAVGVVRALHERGLDVPGDVSVVGCDDVFPAAHLDPSLTTVRLPFADTGRQATDLLLRLVDGEDVPPLTRPPVRLVTRESTAPPPTAPSPPSAPRPPDRRRPARPARTRRTPAGR